MSNTFPQLPCFPCPHQSACCGWGATLTEEEARGIRDAYGEDKAYLTRWGEWRTRIKGGRCVLWKDNACSIYHTPWYPAVCGGFPWTDAETGGAYEFDQTICPEFLTRPDLVQLNGVNRPPRSTISPPSPPFSPGSGS
ncbi:MAG: hypothetical protein ABI613_03745 [Gemmatimonadota bacterium]